MSPDNETNRRIGIEHRLRDDSSFRREYVRRHEASTSNNGTGGQESPDANPNPDPKTLDQKIEVINRLTEGDIYSADDQKTVWVGLDDLKALISQECQKARIEILDRVALEVDANVCECGKPWSESDLYDYVHAQLKKETER